MMIELPKGLRAKRSARPLTGWDDAHNAALEAFEHKTSPDRSSETAILALAWGINEWCRVHGADGFSRANVVQPLFEAFGDALNFDLGRLDGGTLSSWSADALRKMEIDPDTYEWLPDAGADPTTTEDDDSTYRIVRKCFDENHPDHNREIANGLSLDEAQAHCQRDDTHGDGWMDCYYEVGR